MSSLDIVMAAAGSGAAPGTTWKVQTYRSNLSQVIYAQSKLTMVTGPGAQALQSTDGITWQFSSTGIASASFFGLVWTGTYYFSFAGTSNAVRSSDGATWASVGTVGVSVSYLSYANGLLLGSGFSGALATSTDGVTWTTRTSGTTETIYGVVWTGTQYVASCSGGVILTSPDAATWTLRSVGSSSATLYGIAWNGSLLVAAGGSGGAGVIYTSPDGITWTSRTSPTLSSVFGLAWVNSRFIGVGADIITSSDGITWANVKTSELSLSGVAYTGSTYVATGSGAIVYTSPDAVTWTLRNTGTLKNQRAVAWGNGVFASVGDNAGITSSNGTSWTVTVLNTANLYSVAYSPSLVLFAAGGSSGNIRTSPDGINWTTRTSGVSTYSTITGMAFGGGKFVGCTNNAGFIGTQIPKMTYSADGLTWTAVTPASATSNDSFSAIAWDGTKFVATVLYLGAVNYVFTSTDGITWTKSTINLSLAFKAIAWAGSVFVAVTATEIYSSPDGLTWTLRASGPSLTAVTWTGVLAVVTGVSYYVATSPDGITWTSYTVSNAPQTATSGTNISYSSVAGNTSNIVLVGAYGLVSVSPALTTSPII